MAPALYCKKAMTTITSVNRDRGISEKYYSLEFSSLTIVVNSEHFITSKHGGHGFLAV
jgi:hypothetical protein